MTVEKRPCPGCGADTDYSVTPGLRGQEVVILKGTPHKAPCGRRCAEGSDVSISETSNDDVHHRHRCDCRKIGRGYPRPGEQRS